MEILTSAVAIDTTGRSQMIDLTGHVATALTASGLQEGSVLVFVGGSTASISTVEFEPGLRRDVPEALERLIPSGARYHHNDTWNDGNGYSHVRATIMGPSVTIPFAGGRLLLGTWQQIVLIDHDNGPRRRSITIQLTGKR